MKKINFIEILLLLTTSVFFILFLSLFGKSENSYVYMLSLLLFLDVYISRIFNSYINLHILTWLIYSIFITYILFLLLYEIMSP